MKSISFNHLEIKKELPENEYEFLVNETAKLLKRPYMHVHRMVASWSLSKIRDRLHEAKNHHGELRPEVYWFWKRKQEKQHETKKEM